MKKRVFLSLVLAFILCLSLAAPASALWDYGLVYDGTELLDGSMLDSYGRTVFPGFKSSYGAELRVDIVTESDDAEKTAETYFGSFLYGNDTDGKCAVLTLCVKAADGNISFVDGCVYAAGEQWLVDAADKVEAKLSESFTDSAWSGSLSQDNAACETMLKTFFEGMSEAALSAGAVNESAAEEGEYTTYSGNPEAQLGFVTDEAGILTEEQRSFLEARAAQVSAEQSCGVYMVMVNDYTYYGSGSIEGFAESIFTDYRMGWGDDKDGVVLVLSMAERDYDLLAHGDVGNGAFTDYGKELLSEEFLDNFRNDDWGGGFTDYLDVSELMLQRYNAGSPVDVNDGLELPGQPKRVSPLSVIIILLLPMVIAFAVCESFASKMRTARKQVHASGYVADGGLRLHISKEYFTHRSERRETINHDNGPSRSHSGGGGRGGTTVNSRGFSHRSGKF